MRECRYSSTILDLCARWRPASLPGNFTLVEGAQGMNWIGSWENPKGFLDTVQKRKIVLRPGIEPWSCSS
jgi:hypothetical protein